MARVKLSEFRAKHLLFQTLGQDYKGLEINLAAKDFLKPLNKLRASSLYVSKVDQAQKQRGKNSLVNVGRTKNQVASDLKRFARLGFSYALVEPMVKHQPDQEKYLAMVRTANGIELSYSPNGGIEVESNAKSIQHATLSSQTYLPEQNQTELDNQLAASLFEMFQINHLTFLEINPFIETLGFLPLDAAAEVDSAAEFFVNGAWAEADFRRAGQISLAERAVEELNSKSPASLSLRVLNPNGSIFLLLSGGGASVVVADELGHLNRHKQIANYGEYSGNPNTQETYTYTKQILDLLLNSTARKKTLVIAGGVANFTDVAKTFAGIIRAMNEAAGEIKRQKVKVFVRRGGPNQKAGLESIQKFLDGIKVSNEVYGPDKSLAEVMARVAKATA